MTNYASSRKLSIKGTECSFVKLCSMPLVYRYAVYGSHARARIIVIAKRSEAKPARRRDTCGNCTGTSEMNSVSAFIHDVTAVVACVEHAAFALKRTMSGITQDTDEICAVSEVSNWRSIASTRSTCAIVPLPVSIPIYRYTLSRKFSRKR